MFRRVVPRTGLRRADLTRRSAASPDAPDVPSEPETPSFAVDAEGEASPLPPADTEGEA